MGTGAKNEQKQSEVGFARVNWLQTHSNDRIERYSHLKHDSIGCKIKVQAGERDLNIELAAEKARKNDKDVLLLEAAHILGDSVELLKPGVNLAVRARQAQLLNAQ